VIGFDGWLRFEECNPPTIMKIKTILLVLAGLTLLSACNTTPAPSNFGIQVRSQVFAIEAHLIVSGTGFTPGGTAEINIFGWPKLGDMGPFHAVVDSSGSFSHTEARGFVELSSDQDIASVRVTVRDVSSGHAAAGSTPGTPFVRHL
jgi:hypothetical protein